MRSFQVGEVGGLVAYFGGDDLPPHRGFPFRRPFDLTAKQIGVGGAIIGQGDRARLKLLIADEQEHIQFRHAPQGTGGKLGVPRGANDGCHIRQRHGFVRAVLHVRDAKLVKLDADFQIVA